MTIVSKRIEKNIGRGMTVSDGRFTYVAIATPGDMEPYQIRSPDESMTIHIEDLPTLELLMRVFEPNISKWRLCPKTEPQKGQTDANQEHVGSRNAVAGLPFPNVRHADERGKKA